MIRTRFISALCTPLDEREALHAEGLEAHIDQQFAAGIAGILIAGSMGCLQLLKDDTYRALVEHGVRHARGRGEVLVGVSDMSLARTLERLHFAEQFDVDGVVVLAPWFFDFSGAEIGDYFRTLADRSKKPVYLYDIPGRTGVTLELDLLAELSKHPNIAGIKCSGPWEITRELMGRVADDFRVVPAQPLRILELMELGVRDNLDGVYSLIPEHTVGIARAAEDGDMEAARARQQMLADFLSVLVRFRVHAAASEVFALRGIAGHVTAAPYRRLPEEEKEAFVRDPALKRVLEAS